MLCTVPQNEVTKKRASKRGTPLKSEYSTYDNKFVIYDNKFMIFSVTARLS